MYSNSRHDELEPRSAPKPTKFQVNFNHNPKCLHFIKLIYYLTLDIFIIFFRKYQPSPRFQNYQLYLNHQNIVQSHLIGTHHILQVKQLKKHIVNGKIVKTTHQYLRKLVTLNHVTNSITDHRHIVIVIKTPHTATFPIECLTSLVARITSAIAKTHQLLKIFTV